MPQKPKKPCNAPRCTNLTREKYCFDHANMDRELAAQRDAVYDRQNRDPMITEFYKSAGWRALRQAALIRDHGLCQHCLKKGELTKAVIVHHIVEVTENWDLRFYLSNVESVCRACHNAVHKTSVR